MLYKPDWAEAKERLTNWWTGQPTDRVVALVKAPRRGIIQRPMCDDVPDKYINASATLHNLDAALESTFYGGEAIPAHWVYLGPVPLSGYMGCGMHFEADTVWHSQRFASWDDGVDLTFDPSNQWFQLLCEITCASLQRAKGRYLVSGQGFGCVSDVLADLWGCESTLMAMLERPEVVKAATQRLVNISKALFDQLDALATPHQQGSFDWLNLWAPGRIWTLQSDICCMLSPRTFRDFVLDELRQEAEHVDFSFYHLDGPGAIKHLDAILSIEALDGIQWVPGAGAVADPLEWLDLFHRVQQAGKKLYIFCPPERAKPLLSKISRKDVCLDIWCTDQSCAEDILLELDRIGI